MSEQLEPIVSPETEALADVTPLPEAETLPEAEADILPQADTGADTDTPPFDVGAEGELSAMATALLLEAYEAYPDLDLPGAMEADPGFGALLAAGVPLKRAMDYLRAEERLRQARQDGAAEATRRIARRNARPGHSTRGSTGLTAAGPVWDAEQLRRADALLKAGHYVRL